MNAPEELKAWRTDSGLSQEQAAERVGVRAATWCDWENGKKDPRTDRAQDLERLTEGRVTLPMWADWAREKAGRKEPEHAPDTERAS
jgi:transcriptional regulator with XRE-family HTH domain